jgi:two-component system sensor histidine kinase/response regulator
LHRWLGHLHRSFPAGGRAGTPRPQLENRATPAGSPIDLTALDNVSAFSGASGEALFKRLVARFASVAPDHAAAMRKKLEAGQAEDLWRIAHSLKSSAAALGALPLANRAGEIEQVAREQGACAVRPLLALLDAELAAALKSLLTMTGGSDERVVQRV